MTDDQTERVARAVFERHYFPSPLSWDGQSEETREHWFNLARAAIAVMPGWRDIESAPSRDGTWVLVHSPKIGIEMRLADGDWWRKYGGPTKWMHLPLPPVE